MRSRSLIACHVCALWIASPAGAETFRLANGDQLSGQVIERNEERIVLRSDALGVEVEIPVGQLAPPEPPPEVNPGLLGTRLLEGWGRSVELGVSGSSGNTSEQDVVAGLDLGFEDERRRWAVEARYLLSRSDARTSDHEAMVGAARDWLRPGSPWFWFGKLQLRWDQFESWEERVVVGGGPGYELIDDDEHTLRARSGLSVRHDFGERDDTDLEMFTGLEGEWRIGDDHTLAARAKILPALSDPGEFRNVNGADWKIRLDDAEGLSFKLGLEHEYETDVEDGDERNDLYYYGAVVLDF